MWPGRARVSDEAMRLRLVDRAARDARAADAADAAAGAPDETARAEAAGPLAKLPTELLAAVLQQILALSNEALRYRRVRAAEAEQSVLAAHALASACKYLLRAFRSMLDLRLEVVARMCTLSTPGRDCTAQRLLADGSLRAGRPYYAQLLAEERSRYDLKVLVEALRFTCLHCATDCCAKARRECNLVLSDPTRGVYRSELRKRAVGAGRCGRVKVASGLASAGAPFGPWGQRGLLAANAHSTECAVSLEHAYFSYASSPYARDGNPFQISCPTTVQVFGPKGYLPLEDVDRLAVSGILTTDDAPANQAAAHMETRPYCAIGCVRKDALARDKPMPLIVTQMRYCPRSEFLAVVSSSMQAPSGSGVVPGRTEVRVYRPRESAHRSYLAAELGGVFGVRLPPAEDTNPYTGWHTRYDGGRVEAWFAHEAATIDGAVVDKGWLVLYVLDASEDRRAPHVAPDNGDKERLPTLFVHKLNEPYDFKAEPAARRPDWAFPLAIDVMGDGEEHGAYARAIRDYWEHDDCDQLLTSFDCSPCGRYQTSIWEYSVSPSQSGAVVQWNCTSLWCCGRVMETEMPATRASPRPLLCKVNERGDVVVVLVSRGRSAAAPLASAPPGDLEVRVYTIGSGFEADTHAECPLEERSFDRWFPVGPEGFFVHAATVAANRAMPRSLDARRLDDHTSALSPCGRYLLVVLAHTASVAPGVANNGGVAIFDLQTAHSEAATTSAARPAQSARCAPCRGVAPDGRYCDWRAHARDMAPRALVWNRAGLWLQTARGVLLVGLV